MVSVRLLGGCGLLADARLLAGVRLQADVRLLVNARLPAVSGGKARRRGLGLVRMDLAGEDVNALQDFVWLAL